MGFNCNIFFICRGVMSKFSQNRTTQFDEVEEPKFKKKVKEKRKSFDNTFLEDYINDLEKV